MTQPNPIAPAAPLADVVIEDSRWTDLGLEDLAELACTATLQHLGLHSEVFEIAVLGCDDTRILALNTEFRDKPSPTNVLSWPTWDLSADKDGSAPEPPVPGTRDAPEALGDIAIAYDTCAREADAARKPLRDHTLHLLVHGTLHLLGYDHIRDGDATVMMGSEVEILGKLGLSDPYGDRTGG